MLRCIQLAKNGFGNTYPNPLVGSVIVYKDNIIGEGWHGFSGGPHAEVNAIESVKNKELLKNSTLYVNLEPCSHFGKTPPCSDLILAMKIPKVVIGSTDPNPKVSGKGINKLREGGCDVRVDVLREECDNLNKRFFTFHTKKRPFIILKWAQSQDGFIAPLTMQGSGPEWITNTFTQQYVHKMRTKEQAILVGTKTAWTDNPQLSARSWYGNNPIRIVLDRKLKLPPDLALFDGTIPTIVIAEQEGSLKNNVSYLVVDFEKNLAQEIADKLSNLNIQSLIIEGGAKTIHTFIESNLWDEAYVLEGQATFETGILAPRLNDQYVTRFLNAEDKLFHYKNLAHC
jgi:diaminohydroxyphosphoribosylaminopyrimidine deaminase / 5-amino-6-(5-phosphoribosylamino)uracil reductase